VSSKTARYRKVYAILKKHGFGDIVGELTGNKFLRFLYKRKKLKGEDANDDRWHRFRFVLEELGPTFVKFGQILSNRPGIIPEKLVEELSKLQDRVAPFDYKLVQDIFLQEQGKNPEEIFRSINSTPLASASIAQVHEAYLPTGERIAIKIQRPGIREIIQSDILILRDIAYLASRYIKELASVNLHELVDRFEEAILAELDFKQEINHIAAFYKRFEGNENVCIPKPYHEYSSPNIICMQFLEGIKISNTEKLLEKGYDLKEIAKKGFDTFFTQIFDWGYFHADPHPGNVIVMDGGIIGLLDFGMVGKLSEQDKLSLTELIIGLGRDEPERIVETVERLQKAEIENKKEFEKDMSNFIQEFGTKAVLDIDLNAALEKGRLLVIKHKLSLNPDLYLLLRAVSLLEGMGIRLDPEFRSLEMIKPYAIKLFKRKLNPLEFIKSKSFIRFAADSIEFIQKLPGDGKKIISKLANDQIKLQIQDNSRLELSKQIRYTANLISNTLLTITFLCLSFWSLQIKILNPPTIQFPLPAIILILLAFVFFIKLFRTK